MNSQTKTIFATSLLLSWGGVGCAQTVAPARPTAIATTTRAATAIAIAFPGPVIGAAQIQIQNGWRLFNNAISARFALENGALALREVRDELNQKTVAFAGRDLFTVNLSDGRALSSSQMKLVAPPRTEKIAVNATAIRAAERVPGVRLVANFSDAEGNLQIEWSAILRDGSNAVRQEIALTTAATPLVIQDVQLLDVPLSGAKVVGYTDGAPLATDHLFLGVEHPMAKNEIAMPSARAAAWQPADVRSGSLRIPLGEAPADGVFTLNFGYEKGAHRLDISEVVLMDGETVVATDRHAGFTGNASENNQYRLEVKQPRAGTNYYAVAKIGSDAGTDSYGAVQVVGVATGARAKGSWPRASTLAPGQNWRVASVVGVYPPGQMRRAFAYYLERERAHPYRQYFHYNSWYDLNIGRNDNPDPLQRMTEAQALEVIDAIGKELVEKRGVPLDGYVWDDGWDDFQTLWSFHKGFPNGFSEVARRAKAQGAGTGAWLSPWGGYGGSKNQRVQYGRTQGFEIKDGGFSLAGPKYYATFRDRTVEMIRDYNMNYFKFDGIGAGTLATGAPASIAPDLDGLLRLIAELRQARPDVFINATVGTWASPFWVMHTDSVWRGGEDHGSAGEGDKRNQWMNYRDRTVYERFASKSPLYPLNSLMTHGLLISDRGGPGQMPRDIQGIRNEIRTAIGGGTDLQELYISPRIMTPEMWDVLAQTIQWGRANADVLADTHWIGGDPAKNEVYGYASWSPRKGIILLRNPSSETKNFALDVAAVFELPADAPRVYHLQSPWPDAPREIKAARAGEAQPIELAPFEVVTLETTP